MCIKIQMPSATVTGILNFVRVYLEYRNVKQRNKKNTNKIWRWMKNRGLKKIMFGTHEFVLA